MWALATREARRARDAVAAELDAMTRDVAALRAHVGALERELAIGARERASAGDAARVKAMGRTIDARADDESADESAADEDDDANAAEILRTLRTVEANLEEQRARRATRDARAREVRAKAEMIAARGSSTGAVEARALRARHALKQINYAEPSLKVKLRRENVVGVCVNRRDVGSHAAAATTTTTTTTELGEMTPNGAEDADARSRSVDSPTSSSSISSARASSEVMKTPIDHACKLSPERAPTSSPEDIVAALPASKPQIWKVSPSRRDTSRPSRGVRVNYTEPNLVQKMRRDA